MREIIFSIDLGGAAVVAAAEAGRVICMLGTPVPMLLSADVEFAI
jgi:hypothetical protein